MIPIRIAMPDGTTMHGFASDGVPLERIELRHEMPDGTHAIEVVWLPAPEPETTPAPKTTDAG